MKYDLINGKCPECGISFDGDLIIETGLRINNGNIEKALEYASFYSGWEQYGLLNRWGVNRVIMTGMPGPSKEKCTNCNTELK